MGPDRERFIALGSRLRGIPEVLTLGVKPNFLDYSSRERELIASAKGILYPTLNYAQFFFTAGKPIFPSLETYLYADEKIKQTTLFYMLGIPHPRTKIYYSLHHFQILKDFSFPFVAKIPRRSAKGRGVYKIFSRGDLETYLEQTKIAYIQEFLPHERDLRVVLINYEPVLSYWRVRSPEDFRTNLACGGRMDFENIPEQGIRIARDAALRCRLNDVGMDLIHSGERWYVIEANMKYGRKGLMAQGLDLKKIMQERLLAGDIFNLL